MVDCYCLLLRSLASGKKAYQWFFRFNHRHFQRLYLAGWREKLPSLQETWYTVNASQFWKEVTIKDSGSPSQLGVLTQICIPSPRATIQKPLYLGHLAKAFLSCLCVDFLTGGRRRTLKTLFSILSTQYFPTPSPSPLSSSSLQLHTTALFVQGATHREMTPVCVLIYLLSRWAIPGIKGRGRSWCSLKLSFLPMILNSECLKAWLFLPFWLVISVACNNSWQLSAIRFSWAFHSCSIFAKLVVENRV